MERLEQLKNALQEVDEDKRALIEPLLPEIVFMERRLEDLRRLPHIRVHEKNAARQETTAAGKQYKETVQAYLNAVKVLLTALYRTGSNGADELLSKLREFEI